MVKITIEVPDEDHAEIWWEWYLNEGGDEGFDASLDNAGLEECSMDWDNETRTFKHTRMYPTEELD